MYVNAGVPAAKLGLGIGFFGSCWNAPVTAPLQTPGSSYVVASDNTMSVATIRNLYYDESSYRYDASADTPYLSFTSPAGPAGCTFVSYEDETSVAAKAGYARQAGLGGAIIWQLNEGYNPAEADPSSLLHAVGRAFLGGGTAAATTTGLDTSVPAPVYGQAVTFTARVASADGEPSGVVTFADAGVAVGSAALAGGAAPFTTSALSAGSHSITAAYGGSASFAASTSAPLAVAVSAAQTSMGVSSSRNPSKGGQQVVFTAKVTALSPGGGTPSGTVRFFDGAALLGSAALSQGSAVFKASRLSKGSHAITAQYVGSASHAASASPVLLQTVK
jgi:hypothetical protein